MKHLRKALFSEALNNITPVTDFAYIDPKVLIKMGMKQNTIDLFDSVKNRLKYCQYDSISEYTKLITFVRRSHSKEFIDQLSLETVIANQFSDNIVNSHMIWLAYIISKEQEFTTLLRNLESVWFKAIIYLNLKQVYTILSFYDKINQPLQEKTLYYLLKIVHKTSQNTTDYEIIYHTLKMIEKQQELFKGDPLFIETQKNIESKIQDCVRKAQLIPNLQFFLNYPIKDLQFIIDGLKHQKYQLTSSQMKYLLAIIRNCLSQNPQFDTQQLTGLIKIVTELFSYNNTISNKYQFALLNKIGNTDFNINNYESQIELLQIIDLDYTIKSRDIIKSREVDSAYLNTFIQKYITKTLAKRKLQCSDFDHVSLIMQSLYNNQEYTFLINPFREFIGVYSFLF